jgi:ABC-type enterochelin transport system substrate-binding protein
VFARETAVASKEKSLEAALATVNTAFAILGSRALVILAACGAFTLFGWAAFEPSGWRFATACAFTLFVFGPALWIDRRG